MSEAPSTMTPELLDFVKSLLDRVTLSEGFALDPPEECVANLGEAERLLERVRAVVGPNDHGGYFDSSAPRYLHYFAAAMTLPAGAFVLDVGNAPGHVGIGLHLHGYRITGVNLNAHWRETYPSAEWLERLGVVEHDVEKQPLPFADGAFDAVLFTEVLEHISVRNPVELLRDLYRVLRPGGLLIASTPNVCNISNVWALMNEINVFWPREIFYGGLDRHNREFTPSEVRAVLEEAGFEKIRLYGVNSHNNWRLGAAPFAYAVLTALGDEHPFLRNTTMAIAAKAVAGLD